VADQGSGKTGKPVDLKSGSFPELAWTDGERGDSLLALAAFACAQAQGSVDWYFSKRRRKQQGGMVLRVGAILSTAVAGVLPIFGELYGKVLDDGKVPGIAPGWSTIFIALAGLLVLLDKFWGFTSAWIRFLQTGQELSAKLDTFRMDWEAHRCAWKAGRPDDAQVAAGLDLCRAFVNEVHAVVRLETAQWAAEFQSMIKQIEESSREAASARGTGAVDLQVTNGDQCDGGWRLGVDGGPLQARRGKAVSLKLSPGIHTLAAEGKIGGKDLRVEKSVKVTGGQVTAVSLTLE